MKRGLAVAVAVTVVALVAGACGSRVRDDVWEDLATRDGAVTATTRSVSRDEPDASEETRSTQRSERQNESRRSEKSATNQTDAGPLPAPADGTYTYDETEEGARRSTTEKWSAQRSTDAVTLTSVQTEHDEGDTITTTTKYRVTRRAFEMLGETTTYSDDEPDTCTYKPPVVVLQLPLRTGDKWKASSSCSEDDSGGTDDAVQVEVTGTSNDTVGGKAVKTFLVRLTESFDSTDATSGERSTFTFTDTRHVDPSTLLVVIEDFAFNFDGETNTVHRQLRSMTPT